MIWPITKQVASDGKTDMFNTWEETEPIQQLPMLMVRASDFRRVHDELLDHRKALQYFVDTFGGPETWKAAGYMQIHRGEALKMAKELGIIPHGAHDVGKEGALAGMSKEEIDKCIKGFPSLMGSVSEEA